MARSVNCTLAVLSDSGSRGFLKLQYSVQVGETPECLVQSCSTDTENI